MIQKKYIFIPINDALHWSLAIICHPGKVLLKGGYDTFDNNKDSLKDSLNNNDNNHENKINNYEDKNQNIIEIDSNSDDTDTDIEEEPDKNDVWAGILFLDSLKVHESIPIAKMLRFYLNYEYHRRSKYEKKLKNKLKNKKRKHDNNNNSNNNNNAEGDDEPAAIFTNSTFKMRGINAPLQTNGCDCGVYLLQYVENFIATWPKITMKNFQKAPKRNTFNCELGRNSTFWFDTNKIKQKRKCLRELSINFITQTGKNGEQNVPEWMWQYDGNTNYNNKI